jgi:hypothetical protein
VTATKASAKGTEPMALRLLPLRMQQQQQPHPHHITSGSSNIDQRRVLLPLLLLLLTVVVPTIIISTCTNSTSLLRCMRLCVLYLHDRVLEVYIL